jgi:L-seryl-tRNA(Ser) seleniumtransferase
VLRDTLFERWENIPALRMIRLGADEIHARATELAAGLDAEVVEGHSVIGGGSTPEVSLPTWVIAIRTPDAAAVERRLRQNNPPVIARIEDRRVLVDLRTVAREEEPELRSALLGALLGPK